MRYLSTKCPVKREKSTSSCGMSKEIFYIILYGRKIMSYKMWVFWIQHEKKRKWCSVILSRFFIWIVGLGLLFYVIPYKRGHFSEMHSISYDNFKSKLEFTGLPIIRYTIRCDRWLYKMCAFAFRFHVSMCSLMYTFPQFIWRILIKGTYATT